MWWGPGSSAGRRATLTRFAKGGGSYLSSAIGACSSAWASRQAGRLTVTWPDGSEQSFDGLAVDRYHRIIQGQAKAEPYPANG